MPASSLALEILGATALMLWATALARASLERAFGGRVRQALARATRWRLGAWATGAAAALALQSSTAASALAAGFAARGLITPAAALAVVLGADFGSSLVAQALMAGPASLGPALVALGAALSLGARGRWRHLGRALVAAGLILLALGSLASAAASLRDDPLTAAALARLGGGGLAALALGAALAWLAHSGLATVLFAASLAAAGAVSGPAGLALMLGANVGSALAAYGVGARAGPAAKQALAAALGLRAAAALAALPFAGAAASLLDGLDLAPGAAVAAGHVGFNLALGALGLPLAGLASRLAGRATGAGGPLGERPPLMDPAALDRPRIALSGAGREALRLAETIEQMLRESLRPFREDAPQLREEIRRRDAEADRACAAILAYLTALARRPLAPGDEREVFDLILFTTNLEHVGDIIDKNLMALAEKRQRLGVTFSDEGWDELERMHALALEQFRLSAAVFVTRDRRLARDLVRLKDRVRALEREATAGHLRRLREGEAEPESSALHLDMLRDYKRIVAHATAVATPILEAAGELRGTRLAPRPRAEPEPAA